MSASMSSTSCSTSSPTDTRKGKSVPSCAECRRSKLRCDRKFPCQTCIRRGCADICPDGILAATKGNKVLMDHAQKLTEKINDMSIRIKQLETALVHAQNGSLPTPTVEDGNISQCLLQLEENEHSDIKYKRDMDGVSKSLGSLAIGGEGKAQYYGETAGAEFLQNLMPDLEVSNSCTMQEPEYLGLSHELSELVYAFPFGVCDDRAHLIPDFAEYIPVRKRAGELTDLYYANAAWLFDPVPRDDFERAILGPLYASLGPDGAISLVNFEAHRLSVFFMILSIGVLFDSHPNARTIAEQYHACACATFSLESMVHGAMCASIQALLMIAHFLFLTDRSGNERRWLTNGLCTKVILMLGLRKDLRKLYLHISEIRLERDSALWNLGEEEIQRRRTIFWEFFTWECWASVLHGRPPTLSLAHSDCRFPHDLDPYLLLSGGSELGFHSWKFHYAAACLSVSVQHAFSVHWPSYSSLLELDKRIRSFPLPSHLLSPAYETGGRDWDANPSRAMQQFFVVCERESNLIYIHRCWFAEALRDSPDPFEHEYSQSILTVWRSANILINGLNSLMNVHPSAAGNVWFFWSWFHTSSVLLGAIVVKSPGCKLARSALALLDQSLEVYEEGSKLCRPAATMPMLEKLRTRAHHTYAAYCAEINGAPQPTVPHNPPDDIHDLSAFGGTKGAVINKSPSDSPPSPNSNTSGETPPSSSSVHTQRSSHPPYSLAHHSPCANTSSGSSTPHHSDVQEMAEITYSSAALVPEVAQQPQLGLPYPTNTTLDNDHNQGLPDIGPPLFAPQKLSMFPSFEGFASSEGALIPSSHDSAQQQNAMVPLRHPTAGEDLDLDLDIFGLPPIPQQPMQYSQYPQLQQFQDVLMDNGTGPQPPQIPQDDMWWNFLDGLGIPRDSLA